ncbi:uncharacterized protein BBA_09894 [Beauveria bassiana ARSEF 2860]|uniref:Uncharacterized protein n=1 Tax=Beauveria bassiana (strain ARSEF 2860) TaxID=655819 RepID=J5J2W3_BEAB2|nr:uncharacterized protein BBA_09894 [Beauveria bassiana ARSEF 2860]EJP61148.1 hypothetical protein BBA_09894 [Beauveria bassiana ARSEF 2860]
MQEQQFAANAEQLQNDFTAQNRRILALRDEERDTLARLSSLQQIEVEQVLRLETLQADEQNRQSEIAELEQRRANLREEIRLDLLTTSENGQAGTASQERMPDHDASLRQEEAPQVEQLVAEEERLRALVADLTLQVGRLNDDRQGQVASMAAVETQHRSAVEELMAKESALRSEIEQLEAIVQRLQARLNETAANEKDASEGECSSVDSGVQPPSPPALGTHVAQIARSDDCDETEESRAASGQQTGLALEHMVWEALHSDDEVSNASNDTGNAGDRRSSTASVSATEQLMETSEVQQDSEQVRYSFHGSQAWPDKL